MPLDALTQEVRVRTKGVKRAVRQIKSGMEEVEDAGEGAARSVDKAADSVDEASDQMDEGAKSASTFSKRLKDIGTRAKRWLAGAAVTAVTAASAAMAKATREAVRFEERLRETATLLDGDVEATLDRYASGIDRIRRDLPVTTDLTRALYDAISAGVDPDNAISFLRTAAEASVAGVTDTQTAVDALTSALNSYDRELSEAEEVSDSFFTAVEAGKTTFPELAAVIGRVAPIAAQLGIDLDEVNAALATLTASGQKTTEAATALRGVLAQLVKNGDKFREMGIDLNRVLSEDGLQGVLRRVRKETGGNTEEIQRLFQDVEGLNAVLSLAGNSAAQFAGTLQQMQNKSGATADAVKAVDQGAAALWRTMKNRLLVAARNLGESVLPTLNQVLATTNKLFREAASTDLEKLLTSIRKIEGLDSQVEQQLLATIDIRQAREQLETLREDMQDEITVGVDFSPDVFGESVGLTGPEVAQIQKPLEQLTRDDLRAKLKAVNTALEAFAQKVAAVKDSGEEVSIEDQLRLQALRSAQEDLLMGLETLTRYEAAQQAVADAQTRLELSFSDSKASIREVVELMQQLDFIDSPEELVRMPTGDSGGDDGFTMPDLLNVSEMAPADREQAMQLARRFVENLRRSVREQAKSAGVEPGTAALMGIDPSEVVKKLNRLLEQFRKGKISASEFQTQAAEAAKSFREELDQAITLLENHGLISPRVAEQARQRLEDQKDELKETKEEAADLVSIFQDLARFVRGIGDLVDAFGDLSDEAETAIRSTASMVDNIARIIDLKEGLNEGQGGTFGELFTSGLGTTLSSVTSIVGAVGAAVNIASSLFSGGDDGKTQEEIAKLNRQIDEQVRALRKNTEQLRRQSTVASDVQGSTAQQAIELFRQLAPQNVGGEVGSGEVNAEQVRDLLQELEDTGIEAFDGLVDLFDDKIESGRGTFGALISIRKLIQPVISELEASFGAFGDSVQGIIAELRTRRDLLGEEAGTLLDVLVQRISDTNFSDPLKQVLTDLLSDVDLSDEQSVKALVEQLTQLLITQDPSTLGLEGDLADVLGDAAPEDLRTLIESIDQFFGGGGGDSGSEQFTTQAAVSRTITEFQANELLAFQQELVQIGRRHGDLLTGILQTLGGDPPDTATLAAARSAVDVPSVSQMRAFEASLRNRRRGVTSSGQGSQTVVVNGDGGGSTTQTFHVNIDVSAQETPESIARKMDEAVGSFLNRRRG